MTLRKNDTILKHEKFKTDSNRWPRTVVTNIDDSGTVVAMAVALKLTVMTAIPVQFYVTHSV